MVESLGGEPPCPLDQASQLFEAIDATYKEVYLDCFVPATYSSDAEKVRYVDNFKTFFEDTLAEVLCSSERGEPQ